MKLSETGPSSPVSESAALAVTVLEDGVQDQATADLGWVLQARLDVGVARGVCSIIDVGGMGGLAWGRPMTEDARLESLASNSDGTVRKCRAERSVGLVGLRLKYKGKPLSLSFIGRIQMHEVHVKNPSREGWGLGERTRQEGVDRLLFNPCTAIPGAMRETVAPAVRLCGVGSAQAVDRDTGSSLFRSHIPP